jgi:hypothetical protein
LRDVSNYLYDVTDGQARLGHVDVFDNDQYGWFDDADVQILATNVYWSDATPNGFQWHSGHVRMPRKDYRAVGQELANLVTREQSEFSGALTLSAACPEPSEPEGHLQCEDYRVKAHELGHYLFGFGDEYRPLTGGRCEPDPGTEHVFGFMDDQYAVSWQDGALEYSPIAHSEMSSAAQYSSPDCENTDQFIQHEMSCWDHWESLSDARGEGYYCPAGRHDTRLHPEDVFVPIIRPEERALPAGSEWVEGPNDYLHAFGRQLINYDVGALLTVTSLDAQTRGTTTQVTVAENGDPVPGISLHTRPVALTPPRIEQGLTSAQKPYQGKVFVMGSAPGDVVRAEGRSLALPEGQAAVEWTWRSGENTLADPNLLTVDVRRVGGVYPVFSSLVYDGGGTVLHRLEIEREWPAQPEYELEKLVDPPVAPKRVPYSRFEGAYEATIGTDLPSDGAITVHAFDDALEPYFFSVRYKQDASVSSETANWIRTPDASAGLQIPATSHSVERIVLSTTSYLPKRAGIGDHAIPVGSVASIATYPPSSPLPSGTSLTIYFTGRDLLVDGGYRGTVESLAMYRWNPGRSDWDLVGGEVNTARLHMVAPAALPGVYALFATALNVGNEGGVATESQVPERFALLQNYPNPFNPTTTISYALPQAADVRLSVYDVLGRQVRELASSMQPAGIHEVIFDATGLPSGIYIYRLQAGDYEETRRMVVVK